MYQRASPRDRTDGDSLPSFLFDLMSVSLSCKVIRAVSFVVMSALDLLGGADGDED